MIVGEGVDDDVRVYFARFLERGDSREDLGRAYFNVYYPHDEAVPRLRRLRHGQLVHAPDLYTEDERKTSPAYNEGMRRFGSQNGLYARLDGPDGLRIFWNLGDPVGGDGWQSADLRLIERLLPHVHRFIRIRQALAAADALGTGLAGLLDNDRIGVVRCSWTAAGAWRQPTARPSRSCAGATGCSTATARCRPRCRRIAATCGGGWGARYRTGCGARPRAAVR